MERITRFRATILVTLICGIMLFFAARLYYMQIIETGGVVDNTTVFITKTRVKAARGDILDCNGNLLVSNRASFDLVINHYVLTSSENPNQSLFELVQLCRQLGIEYTDHLPVTKTAPFTYTLEEYGSTWRSYFQEYLFRRGDGFDSDITAPLLIDKLRESYHIPADWSDEDAFSERYSCRCQELRGRVFEGEICPKCETKVEFKDTDLEITGWIILHNMENESQPENQKTSAADTKAGEETENSSHNKGYRK